MTPSMSDTTDRMLAIRAGIIGGLVFGKDVPDSLGWLA
jgi:hypothetical protein